MNAAFDQLYHRTKNKHKRGRKKWHTHTHTQSPPPQQSGWCHWMQRRVKKSCSDSHCLVTQRHPLEHCFPGWLYFSLCDMQCGTLSLQPAPSAAACPMVSVPAGRCTQWHNLPHCFSACRQSHTTTQPASWLNLPHGFCACRQSYTITQPAPWLNLPHGFGACRQTHTMTQLAPWPLCLQAVTHNDTTCSMASVPAGSHTHNDTTCPMAFVPAGSHTQWLFKILKLGQAGVKLSVAWSDILEFWSLQPVVDTSHAPP